MQKGKKIPQYQASGRHLRKQKSPKKTTQNSESPLEPQLNLAHAKRLKITQIQYNQFSEPGSKQSKNSSQYDIQEKSIKEETKRRSNLYGQVYKSDLRYYSEYLDSCQRMTHNGINYKWPYCFNG